MLAPGEEFSGEWAEPIFYSGLLGIGLDYSGLPCRPATASGLEDGVLFRVTGGAEQGRQGGYLIFTREPVNPLDLLVFLMILGVRLPVRKWADP